MESSSTLLYKPLAYLLYSVAAGDKNVPISEIKAMAAAMGRYCPPVSEHVNAFSADTAAGVQLEFQKLVKSTLRADDAWAEFCRFYSNNPQLFSDDTKELILQTAYFIALAVNGVNKSELYRLTMLQLLFRK